MASEPNNIFPSLSKYECDDTSIQTLWWGYGTDRPLVKKTLSPGGQDARVTLMTLFGNILIYFTKMYETKYKSHRRKTLKQIDYSCKFFFKDMLLNRLVPAMSRASGGMIRWTMQVKIWVSNILKVRLLTHHLSDLKVPPNLTLAFSKQFLLILCSFKLLIHRLPFLSLLLKH